ncbi:MAG: hypothetical protein IJ180_00955 [Bacteroidales bacterium]|nr:hypothetical protein [Bacteroidales bacterium]
MKKAFKVAFLLSAMFLAGFTSYSQSANDIVGTNTNVISIQDYKNTFVNTLQSDVNNIVVTCYINSVEYQDDYHTATLKANSGIGAKLQADILAYKENKEEYVTKEFEVTDIDAMMYWQMHELKRDRVIVIGLDENDNVVSILSYNPYYYNSHILNN